MKTKNSKIPCSTDNCNKRQKPIITNSLSKNKSNILGFPFLIILLFCFLGMLHIFLSYNFEKNIFNNNFWHNSISMLFFIMILSSIFKFIADRTPIIKDIGGSSILYLLVPAFLLSYKFFPESSSITQFQQAFKAKASYLNSSSGIGFSEFFVSALISGSLLNIKKHTLNEAFKRFLPLVIISLIISGLSVGIMGYFFKPIGGINGVNGSNYNFFVNSIFYIFVPIASGGLTCGIIPLTMIFSQGNTIFEEKFKSHIIPALLISGIFSVILSGLIKKFLGKTRFDSPDGNLEKKSINKKNNNKSNSNDCKGLDEKFTHSELATGFISIFVLYVSSSIARNLLIRCLPLNMENYIPPTIIFLVLLVLLFKFFDIMPSYYVNCTNQASTFITKTFTPTVLMLVGCGIDINKIINSFYNIPFLVICMLCVIITALSAAIIGNKFGYYPVQSAISAGLCANSIGGAGNIAILEASKSFVLMPYAQIATRLGGDIIVILSSIFFPLFYNIQI
ncbi:malate:citrate symporter [Texas Phoenix palm phytoplasma]|uniref:Malate:citrate symporter n=1 Tax=Texas Phoenix palm phytoplasma TaxID=176709 RepID=A0ABS5BIR8_9MOLU|nr:2-hydroxycarboxylate transporter family protein [Texas Phoenix palm phytoplasma]MBP3059478.1 malate:citrate symporter [Texas Phoenix palm phytoplasma]